MLGGLSEGMAMVVKDEMMGCWEEKGGWWVGGRKWAVRSGNGGTGLVRVMRQRLLVFGSFIPLTFWELGWRDRKRPGFISLHGDLKGGLGSCRQSDSLFMKEGNFIALCVMVRCCFLYRDVPHPPPPLLLAPVLLYQYHPSPCLAANHRCLPRQDQDQDRAYILPLPPPPWRAVPSTLPLSLRRATRFGAGYD